MLPTVVGKISIDPGYERADPPDRRRVPPGAPLQAGPAHPCQQSSHQTAGRDSVSPESHFIRNPVLRVSPVLWIRYILVRIRIHNTGIRIDLIRIIFPDPDLHSMLIDLKQAYEKYYLHLNLNICRNTVSSYTVAITGLFFKIIICGGK